MKEQYYNQQTDETAGYKSRAEVRVFPVSLREKVLLR